jgi:chorismate dehydratase
VPGVAIGCDGPVRSVQLVASRPLAQVRRVLLDRSSLTSIHLAQVLARELLAIEPEWVLSGAPLQARDDWQAGGFDAAVAIGDTALAWEGRFPHALDLGEGWKRLTGLPFVFAGWVERPGLRLSPAQEATFAHARDRGLANLDAIAAAAEAHPGCPCRDVRDYLGRAIQFGLGPRQLESIDQFRNRLAAHGLLVEPSAASAVASRP